MAVAERAGGAVLGPAVSETAARLFREHSGWIYGYCLRLLRSPEDAEDALQATYLSACRSLSRGVRPSVDSAWLLRITHNACLTRLRSSHRRARFEQVHAVSVLETAPAPDREADDLVGLTDALASLSEQQRRAILLREWRGLSHREVAGQLGLTQAASETLVFRARRSLAAALENPGKRSRPRSLLALDLGGLLAAIKGFFAGVGVKTVATVMVTAATTATVAATDPGSIRRDRAEPVPAPAVEQAPSPARAERTERGAPVRPSHDSAERRVVMQHDPAVDSAGQGRTSNDDAAVEAKASPKHGNIQAVRGQERAAVAKADAEPGIAKGKALGHARKNTAAPKSSNGRGTPAGGRPEPLGHGGPPPHTQAIGHAQKAGKSKAERAVSS
jgi:RNA polymerase sigma factor (sigma-70 family)